MHIFRLFNVIQTPVSHFLHFCLLEVQLRIVLFVLVDCVFEIGMYIVHQLTYFFHLAPHNAI